MTSAPTAAALLQMRGIVMEFPGVRALDGVDFDLRPGEIHALVGENGAGKSTLIKILTGVYPRYGGELEVDGVRARFQSVKDAEAQGIGVIHQELALIPHLTVAENIFLGNEPSRLGLVDWDRMFLEAETLIGRLGHALDARTEIAHLSVAEQQLVEVVKALRKRSRILVLDEPTSALSDHEVERLMTILRDLRREGAGIVYISHKLDEVFQLADRITVLRDGRTIRTDVLSLWTRESVVQAMVGRELTEMYPKTRRPPGRVLLEAQDIRVRHPRLAGRFVLEGISLRVHEGEVLGIAGLMGAGRSELLSTLFGSAPGPASGVYRVDGRAVSIRSPAAAIRAGLAFVPEDRKRQGLVLMASVALNLSLAHLETCSRAGIVDDHQLNHRCQSLGEEVGLRSASLEAAVGTLSGGNQQKVVLGKWLLKKPMIFLMDEPTRGIDVGAKAEIYRLIDHLTALGLAVILVCSELSELLAMSDRILVLREGRLVGELDHADATPETIMSLLT